MKIINDISKFKFIEKRLQNECTRELYNLVPSLEVSHGLKITKEEWTRKTAPSIPHVIAGNKRYSVRTLENNSGWLIIRIK